MKLLKRVFSGVIALTMAVSMALSTAVQASAAKKSDGSHELTMRVDVRNYLSVVPPNTFFIEDFDKSEFKSFDNADAKGYVVAKFSYYRDENNYIQFSAKYDYGFWSLIDTSVNDSELKKDLNAKFVSSKTDYYMFIGTDMEITLFNKYKKSPYKYWSIVAYDDKDNVVEKYSLGKNVPAKDSKILANIEDEEETKDIGKLTFSKISDQSYTGKECKPSVTVKDGKTKLTEGKDYTLTYKNNKKIGKATVTVKGKGSYTGEKTIEYKIVPKKTTLKVSKKSETKAAFSWTAVKGAEKYEIYCSKDGGKTYKKFKTVSGEETSYTSTKLDFKKYDYKFKIRSYGVKDSKKYYSSYSKVVTVK